MPTSTVLSGMAAANRELITVCLVPIVSIFDVVMSDENYRVSELERLGFVPKFGGHGCFPILFSALHLGG